MVGGVAPVTEFTQDGLGDRQPASALGVVVGQSGRRKVQTRVHTVVGEGDPDLVGEQTDLHAQVDRPPAAGMLDDVRAVSAAAMLISRRIASVTR